MDNSADRQIVDILRLVADGRLDPDEALKRWPTDADSEPVQGTAWHALSHYSVDGDIRARDAGYAAWQKGELIKHADAIAAGVEDD